MSQSSAVEAVHSDLYLDILKLEIKLRIVHLGKPSYRREQRTNCKSHICSGYKFSPSYQWHHLNLHQLRIWKKLLNVCWTAFKDLAIAF